MIRKLGPIAFSIFYACFGAGCSAPDDRPAVLLAPAGVQVLSAPPIAAACGNHEVGCPCAEPGEVIDCGRVTRAVADSVWCSSGLQTCDEYGAWGKCEGDQLAAPP